MDRRTLLKTLSVATVTSGAYARDSEAHMESVGADHRLKIIGIGGAGSRLAQSVKQNFPKWANAVTHVDDQFRGSPRNGGVPTLHYEHTLAVTTHDRKIFVEPGASASHLLLDLKDNDLLVLLCGLGGQMVADLAPALARRARMEGLLVASIGIQPLHFEGEKRIERAQQTMSLLSEHSSLTMFPSNEEMSKSVSDEISVDQFFRLADKRVLRVIEKVILASGYETGIGLI